MLFSKRNIWHGIVGVSGFIGVAMGAAGAHVVSDVAAAALVEKASLYQLIHTLALLWLMTESSKVGHCARVVFCLGILFFSGSLYLKGVGLTASTPAAPLGGVLLMAGWILTALSRNKVAIRKIS